MAASNPNLEKAALLVIIESPEFKIIKEQMADIVSEYRSEEEDSSFYSAHYVLDFYGDGSGSICSGDIDYCDGKFIVEYS